MPACTPDHEARRLSFRAEFGGWRVSAHRPCPVCGGDSNCQGAKDGAILCRRRRDSKTGGARGTRVTAGTRERVSVCLLATGQRFAGGGVWSPTVGNASDGPAIEAPVFTPQEIAAMERLAQAIDRGKRARAWVRYVACVGGDVRGNKAERGGVDAPELRAYFRSRGIWLDGVDGCGVPPSLRFTRQAPFLYPSQRDKDQTRPAVPDPFERPSLSFPAMLAPVIDATLPRGGTPIGDVAGRVDRLMLPERFRGLHATYLSVGKDAHGGLIVTKRDRRYDGTPCKPRLEHASCDGVILLPMGSGGPGGHVPRFPGRVAVVGEGIETTMSVALAACESGGGVGAGWGGCTGIVATNANGLKTLARRIPREWVVGEGAGGGAGGDGAGGLAVLVWLVDLDKLSTKKGVPSRTGQRVVIDGIELMKRLHPEIVNVIACPTAEDWPTLVTRRAYDEREVYQGGMHAGRVRVRDAGGTWRWSDEAIEECAIVREGEEDKGGSGVDWNDCLRAALAEARAAVSGGGGVVGPQEYRGVLDRVRRAAFRELEGDGIARAIAESDARRAARRSGGETENTGGGGGGDGGAATGDSLGDGGRDQPPTGGGGVVGSAGDDGDEPGSEPDPIPEHKREPGWWIGRETRESGAPSRRAKGSDRVADDPAAEVENTEAADWSPDAWPIVPTTELGRARAFLWQRFGPPSGQRRGGSLHLVLVNEELNEWRGNKWHLRRSKGEVAGFLRGEIRRWLTSKYELVPKKYGEPGDLVPKRVNASLRQVEAVAKSVLDEIRVETDAMVFWRPPDFDQRMGEPVFWQPFKGAGDRTPGQRVISNPAGHVAMFPGSPEGVRGKPLPNPMDLVSLENCLLDAAAWERDGELRTIPHTPRLFYQHTLPYALAVEDVRRAMADGGKSGLEDLVEQRCPELMRFLREAFGWGEDSEQAAESMYELRKYVWYVLRWLVEAKEANIAFLFGPDNAGKGTLMEVIQAIVGEGNWVATSIDEMADKNHQTSWMGKRLACASEAEAGDRADLKRSQTFIKRVSGQDAVSLRRLYELERPAERLYTRLLMLANEMPDWRERSGAMFASRALLFKFSKSHTDKATYDPGLKGRIIAEAPNAFLWALAGGLDYGEAKRSGGRLFQQPKQGADVLAMYKSYQTFMPEFVREWITITNDPKDKITVRELHAFLVEWRRERGDARAESMGDSTLSKGIYTHLQKAGWRGSHREQMTVTEDGKQRRRAGFDGLKWTQLAFDTVEAAERARAGYGSQGGIPFR